MYKSGDKSPDLYVFIKLTNNDIIILSIKYNQVYTISKQFISKAAYSF